VLLLLPLEDDDSCRRVEGIRYLRGQRERKNGPTTADSPI
jgi:hypothetical protein